MIDRPQRLHTYRNAVFSSARWDAFKPREGDVIVCAPPKCGTTWTVKLCAMLLHGSAVLPKPLGEMVRWLDHLAMPLGKVMMELDVQAGRRIIKTHTPLDGLPYFEGVKYVFCGRDPRDAFLSMLDHVRNSKDGGERGVEGGASLDPNVLFGRWCTVGQFPWMFDGAPFQSVAWFTQSYWAFRRLPNLIFLHYRDLSEDLDGEMRRLADFLDAPVEARRWPQILEAGSFAAMREAADQNAPGADRGAWRSNTDFFRKGRLDEWRGVLNAHSLALYERVNGERLDPSLKAWMETGRRAAGDPREA